MPDGLGGTTCRKEGHLESAIGMADGSPGWSESGDRIVILSEAEGAYVLFWLFAIARIAEPWVISTVRGSGWVNFRSLLPQAVG